MGLCEACGDKKYPNAFLSDLGSKTVSLGKCPECNNYSAIILERDWLYASGDHSI